MKHSFPFRALAYVMAYVLTITGYWSVCPPPPLAAAPVAVAPLLAKNDPRPTPTPTPSPTATGTATSTPPTASPAPRGTATGTPTASPTPVPPAACELAFFGPKKYERKKGAPTEYTDTIEVPFEAKAPFYLKIVNGDPEAAGTTDRCPNDRCDDKCERDFKHRVTSAWIEVDGRPVAEPRDFSHHVATLTREVALKPTSKLTVKIAGKPGSYLTISVCGARKDLTPPEVKWIEPANGSITKDQTPHMLVRYWPPRTAPTAGPAPSPTPAPVAGASGGIQPWCECVGENPDGTFTAYFGYRNDKGREVELKEEGSRFEGRHRHDDRCHHPSKLHAGTAAAPQSSVAAVFEGDEITWKVKGPDGVERTATASRHKPRCAPAPAPGACERTHFGPERFTRQRGHKTEYERTFTLPPSAQAPFTLRVINGGTGKRDRVSSAWISLNGKSVLGPRDFSPLVASAERGVKLKASNKLRVTLAGKPGSYLTLQICGAQDPYALDLSTLKITLDGVDRTGLFDKDQTEAEADLPDELALSEGEHVLVASIKTNAGVEGQDTTRFRVDLTPPVITIDEPTRSVLAVQQTHVVVSYRDNMELDLDSLVIRVDGQDRTALFTKGPAQAVADLTLDPGPHTIEADIRDRAGHDAPKASRSFRIDIERPTIQIAKPAHNAALGSEQVDVVVTYQDDQGLDYGTLVVKLDGAPVTLTEVGPAQATGVVTAAANRPHTITADIADLAGHAAERASSTFVVDTKLPEIKIDSPLTGSKLNDATPPVTVTYKDEEDAVDLATLKIAVGGTDLRPHCVVGPAKADCTIPETMPLPDGPAVFTAEIQDRAGNRATDRSDVIIDTKPPTGDFEAPPSVTGDSAPFTKATYSGTGTAVKVVRIFLGEQDVTDRFALGESAATGTLPTLADGPYKLRLHLEDEAGNVSPQADLHDFRVDTQAPTGAFTVAELTNDPTPHVVLDYTDGDGAGVDAANVRLFVRAAGAAEWTEVTEAFTRTAQSAVGDLPASALAGDGPYELRGDVPDRVGNMGPSISGTFLLDTVAPTWDVTVPLADAFVKTTTPSFEIGFHDDGGAAISSGVDGGTAVLFIDDKNLTDRFGVTDEGATGTLRPEDALAEGRHALRVVLRDRAGNVSDAARLPHPFKVDTVPPQVTIQQPPDKSLSDAQPVPFAAVYSDKDDGAGNAVEPTSVRIFVDGVEQPGFNPLPTGVTGSLPLAEGTRALRIEIMDLAGNTAEARSTVTVDRTAPMVILTSPVTGLYTSATSIAVEGTATDVLLSRVVVRVGEVEVVAAIQATPTKDPQGRDVYACGDGCTFRATVPLVEGPNELVAKATDALAHEGVSAPVTVTRDTIPPKVTIEDPPESLVTKERNLTVAGTVEDATPVKMKIKGGTSDVDTDCVPAGEGKCTFSASISLGAGPDIMVVAEATDAAGNTGDDRERVKIDRESPRVRITDPEDGAYRKGPTVTVSGEASDNLALGSVTVNGQPVSGCEVGVPSCTFTTEVPVTDAQGFEIKAEATDLALNDPGMHVVRISVDTVAPKITLSSPAPGLTNAPTVRVTGEVKDDSPVTANLNGSPLALDSFGRFDLELPLPGSDGAFDVVVTAEDQPGNAAAPVKVTLTVDRTSPQIFIDAPANGAVLGAQPVSVSGRVIEAHLQGVDVNGTPASVTGQAWHASLSGLSEGQVEFVATAKDRVPNPDATATVKVLLDLTAPTVTITSPASGLITREATIAVTGVATDATLVKVTVSDVEAVITGETFTDNTGRTLYRCTSGCLYMVTVPLAAGDNTLRAKAYDALDREGVSGPVMVTRDNEPPVIQSFETPPQIIRGQTGQASTVVTDNVRMATVNVLVDGAVKNTCETQTGTTLSCSATLEVPEGATVGSSLKVEVEGFDAAGNRVLSEPPRQVTIAASGVLVGQVLDDATGWPLADADVKLLGGDKTYRTDRDGRYSVPGNQKNAVLEVSRAGYTRAQRVLELAENTGTVPLDARLTRLADAVNVEAGAPVEKTVILHAPQLDAAGQTKLVPGKLKIEVKPPSTQDVRLTPLSAQGLPGIVPVGWTPMVALDLMGTPGSGAWPVVLSGDGVSLLTGGLHLAQYDADLRAWLLRARDLTPSGTTLSTELPGPGTYAFLAPDATDPPMPVPASGDAFVGLDTVFIPVEATTTGWTDPSTLPPTDLPDDPRRAVAAVVVKTADDALPSGTVVQAELQETYSLATKETAERPKFRQDILLYRRPHVGAAPLADPPQGAVTTTEGGIFATFPVRPSRSFTNADVDTGEILVDILSGRETARGVLGGAGAVTLAVDDVMLAVPAGALHEDTAFGMGELIPPFFSPVVTQVPATFVPLAELSFDFSGQVLSTGAQVSIGADRLTETPAPTDLLVVAKVQHLAGVPRLAIVALAEVNGEKIVTIPSTDPRVPPFMPGVRERGRFIFYHVKQALGFVAGTATAGDVGVQASIVGCPGATTPCAVVEPGIIGDPTWPFVAYTWPNGNYVIASPAGALRLRAAIFGTSSAGSAEAAVVAAQTTQPVPITLSGAVTTVTVRPANGVDNVPPTEAIELTASAALDPATVSATNIKLFQLTANGEVPVTLQFVLSGSGRSLSVIPQAPPPPPGEAPVPALNYKTKYKLVVAGLKDFYGAPAVVPETIFETKAFAAPEYDLSKLTFELPGPGDEPDFIKIKAPPCWLNQDNPDKCLYPGTEIIVINATNGHVGSFTTGNNGELNDTLPGTMNDVLMVTVTDPFGFVTTFTRSQFYDPVTGMTAIGPGGGVIVGPDGVELRIPEGALEKGIKFRLSSVLEWDDEILREKPDLGQDDTGKPLATFGAGLKLESSAFANFKKEAKLAFPVPEAVRTATGGKPEDAFFYVLRRLAGPCSNGRQECPEAERPVAYETLDFGRIEGEGSKARIVTQSYPFTGYAKGWNRWTSGMSLGAGFGMDVASGMIQQWAIMMWTFTALLPGAPVAGTLTGRVLRPEWRPGATSPTYVGVPGVLVSTTMRACAEPRQDENCPIGTMAETGGDGRFTFYVPKFVTQETRVETRIGGETYSGTVYAVAKTDTKIETDDGLAALRQMGVYNNVATADILVPATTLPPAAPPVTVLVMTETGNDRTEIGSTVFKDTPLRIGFRTRDEDGIVAAVTQLKINGEVVGVVADSGEADIRVDFILQELFTPSQSGVYTITGEALSPLGGAPVPISYTFRVTAEGGGVDNLPGVAPKILTNRTVPKADARGVPITAFMELAFSEPVVNVVGNITLVGAAAGPAPVTLLGTTAEANPRSIELTPGHPPVTAVTIIPTLGLVHGETYRLEATTAIVDLDRDLNANPDPRALDCAGSSCESTFVTFAPEALGGADENVILAGIATLGDRAYALETRALLSTNAAYQRGLLHVYKLDDPVVPERIPPPTPINFPPRDIAAQEWTTQETQDGEPVEVKKKLAAVVTMSRLRYELQGELVFYFELKSTPNNLFLYDVSTDAPRMIGAASLTNNILDGIPQRVVMKDNFVYVATNRKGIQVVDLRNLANSIQGVPSFTLNQALSNDGFNREMVSTVPFDHRVIFHDLDVANASINTGAGAVPVVFATGRPATNVLIVVSPGASPSPKLYVGPVQGAAGSLTTGQAIAIMSRGAGEALKHYALIAGVGTATCPDPPGDCVPNGSVLAIVNVTDPRAPELLSMVRLPATGYPSDILIKDKMAIVSGAGGDPVTLVNVADPARPFVAGTLAGVGSRLALSDNNILLSTLQSFLMSNATPLSGVKTAVFGPLPYITPPRPTSADLVVDGTVVAFGGSWRGMGLAAPVVNAREQLKTLDDIPLILNVFPTSYDAKKAILQLYLEIGGTTVAFGAAVNVDLVGGRAQYTVPKGTLIPADATLIGVLTLPPSEFNALVTGPPQVAPVAHLHLTVDTNNDTVVDDKDDEEHRKEPKKKFQFWEADAALIFGTPQQPPDTFSHGPLTDFATLRVTFRGTLGRKQRIGMWIPSGTWSLVPKTRGLVDTDDCPRHKAYLCDTRTADEQVKLLGLNRAVQRAAEDIYEIVPSHLKAGPNDFLFRCVPRADPAELACGSDSVKLVNLESTGGLGGFLGEARPVGDPIDEIPVEIRPFQQLAGMVSARQSTWGAGDINSPHYRVNPVVRKEGGWKDIETAASLIDQVTVVVHGFNVTDNEFKNKGWFSLWAKRLYWTGHPILIPQKAAVVGVAWPGDRLGGANAALYYPEDEFSALQAGLPVGKFIQSLRARPGMKKLNILAHSLGNMVVNSALKEVPPLVGAPLTYVMHEAAVSGDAFLPEYDPLVPPYSTIPGVSQFVDHAQALGYPRLLPDGTGRAAGDATWAAQESNLDGIRLTLGCPKEAPFLPAPGTSCAPVLQLPPLECGCAPVTRYFLGREAVIDSLGPDRGVDPSQPMVTPFFRTRWERDTFPRNQDGTLAGPWTRFFRPNLDLPGVAIFNTYNANDNAVRIDPTGVGLPPFNMRAWKATQLLGKPRGTAFDLQVAALQNRLPFVEAWAGDAVGEQKWWTLAIPGRESPWRSTPDALADQRLVWDATRPAGTTIEARTRQWAELAFWYPSLAPAAGAWPVPSLGGTSSESHGLPMDGRNVDFTEIGTNNGVIDSTAEGTLSHSYMVLRPLAEVWRGYLVFRDILKP